MKSGDIKVYSNAKEGGKGEHCKRKKKKEGKNNGVSIKKGGKIVVPYVVSIGRWLISFVPLRFFPPRMFCRFACCSKIITRDNEEEEEEEATRSHVPR